uniref:Uncharacterized protein n=1 Tax=uncultured Atribacterota bacterium TaxID=263865 RepID=G3BML1_9BACT|nr:hypothetical protein [uncultured Atribacterota bacterium]
MYGAKSVTEAVDTEVSDLCLVEERSLEVEGLPKGGLDLREVRMPA